MSQFARADSTITSNGWVAIGAATHHQAVDEVLANDITDYVESDIAVPRFIRFTLSNVTDPGTHIGHIVRFRRKGIPQIIGPNATYRVIASGVTIVQLTEIGIANTWNTSSANLSESVAANITDYTDIEIEIEKGGQGNLQVTWIEFEFPDPVVNPVGTAIISMPVVIASSTTTVTGPPVAGTAVNTMPEVAGAGTTIYDPSPRTGPISITNFEITAAGTGLFAATVIFGAPDMPQLVASGAGTTLNPVLGNATITLELVTLATDTTQIQGGIQVGDWQQDAKEVDTWVKDTEEQDVWTKDTPEVDVWS